MSGPGCASGYVFKNPLKRRLAALLDAAGYRLLRAKPKEFPDAGPVAVLRLDHLGDVALAAPFLAELRRVLSGREILLVASASGCRLMRGAMPESSLVAFDAAWFADRPSFFPCLKSWFALIALLRRIRPSAVIDLRGDIRHIAAARIASPRGWIAGTGSTGGGFLLNAAPFRTGAHAAERNLGFLEPAGIEIPKAVPAASVAAEPLGEAQRALLPPRTGKWIALHAGAGAEAKLWPSRHWGELARLLAADPARRFFWIGDERAERISREALAGAAPELAARFTPLFGRMPLSQLGTFLRLCDVLVTTDSGPAHVAGANGVPVVVLFSGSSKWEEWKPVGRRAAAVERPVPCAPCYERRCPLDRHACMEDLEPARAAAEVERALAAEAHA